MRLAPLSSLHRSREAAGVTFERTAVNDRRLRPRSDLLSEGSLFFGTSQRVLQVAAMNMSETGAKLALDRMYALPRHFLLSFDAFSTAQNCRMVWCRGNFVGVSFAPPSLPLASEPAAASPRTGRQVS
jgi:hypothetical protein